MPIGLPTSASCLGSKYAFTRHFLKFGTFTPEQLLDILLRYYDSKRYAEEIVVHSAWYCKRTVLAEHEFIVLIIQNVVFPGRGTCLLIERDPGDTSHAPSGIIGHTRAMFQGTRANDTFKVLYDGKLDNLLDACTADKPNPYVVLEELSFRDEDRLLFHDLVTLAAVVSKSYPSYHIASSNCYLYAGLIWECMRRICRSATHFEYYTGLRKRGRFHALPCVQIAFKVKKVYDAFLTSRRDIASQLEEKRAEWGMRESMERLKNERLEKDRLKEKRLKERLETPEMLKRVDALNLEIPKRLERLKRSEKSVEGKRTRPAEWP